MLCVLLLLMTLHLTFATAIYSWARQPNDKVVWYNRVHQMLYHSFTSKKLKSYICVCMQILGSSKRPHRRFGPPFLPFSGYRRIFLRGLCGRIMTPVTQLQLVPKLRMFDALSPLPYMLSWRAEGQSYIH
jgi:hypothetical protein